MMISEMLLQNGMRTLVFMWIPLCFLVIPSLHALARQNRDLRMRLDAMERQLEARTQSVG